jgi:hypothetical protein
VGLTDKAGAGGEGAERLWMGIGINGGLSCGGRDGEEEGEGEGRGEEPRERGRWGRHAAGKEGLAPAWGKNASGERRADGRLSSSSSSSSASFGLAQRRWALASWGAGRGQACVPGSIVISGCDLFIDSGISLIHTHSRPPTEACLSFPGRRSFDEPGLFKLLSTKHADPLCKFTQFSSRHPIRNAIPCAIPNAI